MKIEQIYTGCLAQGAYYIESKGEVAIIDPLREIQPYINRAKLDDAKIKYILPMFIFRIYEQKEQMKTIYQTVNGTCLV